MGSSLGPLLANIIMTEMKKTFTKNFIDEKKTLLFCGRYVVDTLVVIERERLKLVYDALNNFDKSLNFTADTFDNVAPRGGFRTAATSKMERFVIIVNGWKTLTIITKRSILDVAAVLDPPLAPHFLDIEIHPDGLTLYFTMLKNGQTYLKNLAVFTPQDF